MNIFTAQDLCRIAVQIEENGERFYRFAAGMAKENEAKKIFAFLADEEVIHKKMFSALLAQLEQDPPAEAYPGEELAYIQAFTQNIVFSPAELDDRMSAITTTPAAIDFAIQRELDSIHFYQEIKAFMPSHQHAPVDAVIAEERKHFLKLTELKASLQG